MLPLFIAIEAKNTAACLELLQHYAEQQLHHRCTVIDDSLTVSSVIPVAGLYTGRHLRDEIMGVIEMAFV